MAGGAGAGEMGLFSMEERRFEGDFFAAFQGEMIKRRKRGLL